MKPLTVTGLLPSFEYAYRHASIRVSPIKYENRFPTAASLRFLGELVNSQLTIAAGGAAVPDNPVPRLLSEGYAPVAHA